MKVLSRMLVLFLLIFAAITTQAQNFMINPKVGINATAPKGTKIDTANFSGQSGFNIGVDFRLSRKSLSLMPGIHYYAQGNTIDNTISSASDKYKLQFNSIKVPLLVDYNLTGGDGVIALHVRGGVTGTALLSTSVKDAVAGKTYLTKSDLNSFIFGWQAGLSVRLIKFITIDFTYERSFGELFKAQNTKVGVFAVHAGVAF